MKKETVSRARSRKRAMLGVLAVLSFILCVSVYFILVNQVDTSAVPAPSGKDQITSDEVTPPDTDDSSEMLDEILEETIASTDQALAKLEGKKLVQEHPWQQNRVNNIAEESLAQLVGNLAHFDDVGPAEISFSGLLATLSSGEFCSGVVTRLLRVRRLLSMAASNEADSAEIVSRLRERYQDILERYPSEFDKFYSEWAKHPGTAMPLTEDLPIHDLSWSALSCTYLLAELNDVQSLPLMLKSYRIHDYRGDEGIRSTSISPISPAFTLYTITKLITAVDETSLSPESKILRDAFLEDARRTLHPPGYVQGTKWDAAITEHDPRVQMLNPRMIGLAEPEDIVNITLYPGERTLSGKKLSNMNGKVYPDAERLFELAAKFIENME